MSETLTPEALADLQRLAEGATPGPWKIDSDASGMVFADAVDSIGLAEALHFDADAAYIAAANPATVLALITQVRAAEKERHTLFLESGRLLDVWQKKVEAAEARWSTLRNWMIERGRHGEALDMMSRLDAPPPARREGSEG